MNLSIGFLFNPALNPNRPFLAGLFFHALTLLPTRIQPYRSTRRTSHQPLKTGDLNFRPRAMEMFILIRKTANRFSLA
jgi:hypothetical protein